jgi:hypothetical protein
MSMPELEAALAAALNLSQMTRHGGGMESKEIAMRYSHQVCAA